jgi:hypothetical protein
MPRHERLMRAWATLAFWVSGFWITFALWVASLILPPVLGDPSLVPVFFGAFVVCACCSAVQTREVKRLMERAG